MADYFTQFSCMFDVGSTRNARAAIELCRQQALALFDGDGNDLGFQVEHDPEAGPGALWISSDEYGEPEHVVAFVLACAEAFDLQGRWGFVRALTCSRPRLDGFGGGAQMIDLGARKSLAWLDCEHCLQGALDPAFHDYTAIARTTASDGVTAMASGAPPPEH